MISTCIRGVSGWILGKLLKGKELEQAAQGSGGVIVPGGVQEVCRHGTEGHSLASNIGDRWTIGRYLRGLFQP